MAKISSLYRHNTAVVKLINAASEITAWTCSIYATLAADSDSGLKLVDSDLNLAVFWLIFVKRDST